MLRTCTRAPTTGVVCGRFGGCKISNRSGQEHHLPHLSSFLILLMFPGQNLVTMRRLPICPGNNIAGTCGIEARDRAVLLQWHSRISNSTNSPRCARWRRRGRNGTRSSTPVASSNRCVSTVLNDLLNDNRAPRQPSPIYALHQGASLVVPQARKGLKACKGHREKGGSQ